MGRMQNRAATLKNILALPLQKLNMKLPHDLAFAVSAITPEK
jgi:hypothetical protein